MDPGWVRVWLLDMALAGDGKVAVLMAAYNPNISQQIHYAIGTLRLIGALKPNRGLGR